MSRRPVFEDMVRRASSADCLGMDATTAASAACDYLAYTAYSLIGVLWFSMADTAAQSDNTVIATAKQKTRDFYIENYIFHINFLIGVLNFFQNYRYVH